MLIEYKSFFPVYVQVQGIQILDSAMGIDGAQSEVFKEGDAMRRPATRSMVMEAQQTVSEVIEEPDNQEREEMKGASLTSAAPDSEVSIKKLIPFSLPSLGDVPGGEM